MRLCRWFVCSRSLWMRDSGLRSACWGKGQLILTNYLVAFIPLIFLAQCTHELGTAFKTKKQSNKQNKTKKTHNPKHCTARLPQDDREMSSNSSRLMAFSASDSRMRPSQLCHSPSASICDSVLPQTSGSV